MSKMSSSMKTQWSSTIGQCLISAFLTVCLNFAIVTSQGQMAPHIDPFGPPPMPPNYQNPPPQTFYNNPPPSTNYAPPPQMNYMPPPNNYVQPPPTNYMPPLPPINNFQPPNTVSADISKPMPADAAAAGQASYSTTSQGEREFEGDVVAGGGGVASSQTYYPPPSFGMQSSGAYGPSDTLLDAYYGPSGGGFRYRERPRNNGMFGGLFGNSPAGNLMGAYMINEWVF